MVLNAPDSRVAVQHRIKGSANRSVAGCFHNLSFQAMNTLCRVNFLTPEPRLAAAFQSEVLSRIAAFEARYSRLIADSLIGRINAAAGRHWVEVDPETDALFNLCQEMIFFTHGVF